MFIGIPPCSHHDRRPSPCSFDTLRNSALATPSVVPKLRDLLDVAISRSTGNHAPSDEQEDPLLVDSPFENPVQVSPAGAAALAVAFGALRDCCIGSRSNQDHLRNTGFSDVASERCAVLFKSLGSIVSM